MKILIVLSTIIASFLSTAMRLADAEEAEPRITGGAKSRLDLGVNLQMYDATLADIVHFLDAELGIRTHLDSDRLPKGAGELQVTLHVQDIPVALVCQFIAKMVTSQVKGQAIECGMTADGTILFTDEADASALAAVAVTTPRDDGTRWKFKHGPLRLELEDVPAATFESRVMSQLTDPPVPVTSVLGVPGSISLSALLKDPERCSKPINLFMNGCSAETVSWTLPLKRALSPAWRRAPIAQVLADISAVTGVQVRMSAGEFNAGYRLDFTAPDMEALQVLERVAQALRMYWSRTATGLLLTCFGRSDAPVEAGSVAVVVASLGDRLISIAARQASGAEVGKLLSDALGVKVTVAVPDSDRLTLAVQRRSVTDILRMIAVCTGWSAHISGQRIDLMSSIGEPAVTEGMVGGSAEGF